MPNSSVVPAKAPRGKEPPVGSAGGRATSPASPSPTSNSSGLTYEQIARRAYEIYEREGRQPGRDLENWLRAEAELKGLTKH